MKVYCKVLSKIRNNKARVKKVVGIVSVAVGLRYGKINSIPTSLSSNPTQQVEQVQNYVEEDIQVIDTDGKVIKTGSGILLGSSTISEGSKSILIVHGGDLGKSGPGPRAKADASRNAKARVNRAGNSKANNSQSGGSPFVEAFTVEPSLPARPGQTGDGRFSRFPSQVKPDPKNPGCSGRPRSVKVLSVEGRPVSEQLNSDSATEHSIREIIAHDGVKGRLTDKSANHLTSNHGHVLSIDDPLPPSPNQKVVKFTKIRTRINKDNKKQFADTLEKILQDPNSEPYPDVNIRGIKGHGYYNENYGEHGFFVGIHNEGEFKGQIMKAQPISEQQLEILQDENKID